MINSHVWRASAVMVLAATAAAGSARADSVDLNLNDDAARLTYARSLAENRLEIDIGWPTYPLASWMITGIPMASSSDR